MYGFLSSLLSDKKGGITFSCFGIWHFLYLFVIFGAIILVILFLKNKSQAAKQRAINISVNLSFVLYIADFFLMPFAYGEIDLEKLPFHICTAMCVMCFISRHNKFFEKFKTQFVLLGLASNLIYSIYPAGVGWYQVHPLSYRVFQTLLFHGSMCAYGIFVLAFENVSLKLKNCYKELIVIVAMTLWAMLGNALYNGTSGEYSHNFNWFFVLRDPFYILPQSIAPYIMPLVMMMVFFVADMLIYLVYFWIKNILNKCL